MAYIYGLDKDGNVWSTFNWDAQYDDKCVWTKVNMRNKEGQEVKLVQISVDGGEGSYGSAGAD